MGTDVVSPIFGREMFALSLLVTCHATMKTRNVRSKLNWWWQQGYKDRLKKTS